MLFDDAVDGCQAETRAFADLFSSKERFEYATNIFVWNAAAGVGGAHANEAAWVSFRLGEDVESINVLHRDFNGEQAAFGHCVARIHNEIQEHLLHHSCIRLDASGLRAVTQLQGDILSEDSTQHFCHVADNFVHVEAARLHDLAAAEGEQLPRQCGGAFGSLGNLLG